MDLDKLDTCNVCMEFYDDHVRPRCLPCGHNFCGSCIAKFFSDGTILCPHCKKSHGAKSSEDFPINYDVEALISVLRVSHDDLIPKYLSRSITRPSKSGTKLQLIFDAQKESLRELIERHGEVKSDLLVYDSHLHQLKERHEELLLKIHEIAKLNEEISKQIDVEKEKLAQILEEGDEKTQEAVENLSKYEHVTSVEDIIQASDEVERCYDVLDRWRRRVQRDVPDTKTIKASYEIMRDTAAAVSIVSRTNDSEAGNEIPADTLLSLPTMDKLMRIRENTHLPLKILQSAWPSIANLVDVYAVQIKEGKVRSAQIAVTNGKTYLHCLQDKEPPADALIIQHSELLETLNCDYVVAFMDLSWEGSVQGRVHIALAPDTPLARNFKTLCIGNQGPSYAHSNFLKVVWKGNETYEYVCGGDYELNDGSGGAPLLSGLNPMDDIYSGTNNAGIVWARYDSNDRSRSSQFMIKTGKGSDEIMRGVFGQIQDGLEVIRDASRLENIKEVKIKDCGVVLSI